MNRATRTMAWVLALTVLGCPLWAQDWPQWRGPNRDDKAAGFTAPATWPKTLTQKWKVAVGDGVSTPALVGDKLYVFARQDGNEVLRCLDAATGKELWQNKYESAGASGPAAGFSGPRSSPAVADGKAVTLGVRGMVSCVDAASGKVLWRKDDFKAVPNFCTACSPMIVDGMVILQLGGRGNGGIVAYDLASGDQKWKWTGDAPAYASPSLMTVDGTKLVLAMTDQRIVALTLADGKLVWETPFAAGGMGAYNAATPVVDGQTLIYSGGGRGTKAVKIQKEGDAFTGKQIWSNAEKSVQFNTPVVKDGMVYGLSQANELFCLKEQTGEAAWSNAVGGGGGGGGMRGGGGAMGEAGAMGRAGGMGGRGGRGGGRGGYGSIIDAGLVLVALTPASELIVFQAGDKYTETAKIKVAESPTHAHPILSGKRVFVKDQDSVILWTIG